MAKAGTYLVIYDISCNHERNKVSKALSGFGFRIQKSAFECKLLKSTKYKMIRQLETLEIETGTILLYRIHNQSKRLSVGLQPEKSLDDGYAFVI